MRGYACSNCGAKPKTKIEPPGMTRTHCHECGKPLTIKMSETETIVVAKVAAKPKTTTT